MNRLSGRAWRRLAVMASFLSVFGCCGCLVAAYAVPLLSPASGQLVKADVCAGVTTFPRTQVGVWWQWVEMSLMLDAKLSPYVKCVTVPWPASFWSARGQIAFPP